MIEYLSPAGSSVPSSGREYGVTIGAGPVALGLLSNGYQDSAEFLAAVADNLRPVVHLASARAWNKVDLSKPATEEMLDEIAAECDAVITAWGHCGACTVATVKDGVRLGKRGVAVVVFVTENFLPVAQVISEAEGMPDLPLSVLPYPTAGIGCAALTELAAARADPLLELLKAGAVCPAS